jgi:hypothetical protein
MRLSRWLSGVAVMTLCCATTASAQDWGRGWFERLSGPGPFEGFQAGVPVGCRWDTSGPKTFYWFFETPLGMGQRDRPGPLAEASSTRTLCIDFQYTSTTNKDSEDVGLLVAQQFEGNVSFPLERERWPWLAAIEPSIGAGLIRFRGPDFAEWRLTLSPQIVFKPLKLIRPTEKVLVRSPNKRGDWRGIIEIAYGAMLIAPKITNEDLRVTSLPPFEHGWLQRATWIRINGSELFGLR